jgi:hypothetical protein
MAAVGKMLPPGAAGQHRTAGALPAAPPAAGGPCVAPLHVFTETRPTDHSKDGSRSVAKYLVCDTGAQTCDHRKANMRRATVKKRTPSEAAKLPDIPEDVARAVSEIVLPCRLSDPLDYYDLYTAVEHATRYSTAVFHAAIGVKYATPDAPTADRMSDTVMRLYASFDRYWSRHRGEMTTEDELAEDDAGSDRLSSWVACFLASTIALVAGACIFERTTPGRAASVGAASGSSGALHCEAQPPDDGAPVLAKFDTRRNGVPFTRLTASSFASVCDQRIAQTTKRIVDYDEWDISEALDAIGHAWRRLRIDEDVEAYVTALRVRFGMLVLAGTDRASDRPAPSPSPCPSPSPSLSPSPSTPNNDDDHGWPNAGALSPPQQAPSPAPSASMSPPPIPSSPVPPPAKKRRTDQSRPETISGALRQAGVLLGRVGRDGGLRDVVSVQGRGSWGTPSARCVGEMAARFLAFAEMRSVARRNAVAWSPMAAERFGLPPMGLPAVGSEYVIGFADRIGSAYDIPRAAEAVARTLQLYAAETERYGSVPTVYRRKLQDTYVCPGEPGIVMARDPSADASTKNVVRIMRGSRIFSAIYERSREKPAAVLARAAGRLGGPTRTHDVRSVTTSDEEYASLCCMHTLFKSRFGIDWTTWFLVTRATYREARKTRGIGGPKALPVVIAAWNTYDVLYRGAVLRTSSIFESMAWWLAIMRQDHGSRVVAMNESGAITLLSPLEVGDGSLGRDDAVAAGGSGSGASLNLEALPVSSSVVVSIAQICDIVVSGHRSFVAKTGGLEGRDSHTVGARRIPQDEDADDDDDDEGGADDDRPGPQRGEGDEEERLDGDAVDEEVTVVVM